MLDINTLSVDPDKVQNGTWVDYLRGSRLLVAKSNNKDAENFRLQKAIEHADIFNAGGDEAEKLAQDIENEVLARFILRDWEGIGNGDDPLEYTPELGIKIFSDPTNVEFRDDVMRIARNREHYRNRVESNAVERVKKAAAS